MNSRQLVKLAYCICLLPLFFACSSERDEGNEGSGTLHVQVNANTEVLVGTNTRMDEGTDESILDVNDFSFSIFKGETLRGEWATLAEFLADDELTLRSGNNYVAKASYGDVNNEGFELPYYEGNQPFVIKRGQTTTVEVTCYLANAKLSIVYTDEFKDYFSEYTAEVTTSLGNTVNYVSDETRYAYFKPGEVQVRVKVKKKEGYSQEVTLKVGEDYALEARHAYILTLDLDAGTPSINISFSDDIPNQEPVTIIVSDEALSAPAPYFTANGFNDDQPIDVVEGKSAEASEVYAYLNAAGGIAHCYLTTHSSSLIEQGWPETVDLTSVSAENLSAMQKLGFQMAGLGDKKDKIAKIDFTNVVPFLEYTEEGTEHLFELRATDKLSKENVEPLKFRVSSKDNQFAVSAGQSVLYGTTKMKANLTLDGDPAKVTYWLKKGETEQQVVPSSVKSNGTSHDLVFKFDESQYADIQMEARYLRRKSTLNSMLEAPAVSLYLEYPGDVWTKEATLHKRGTLDESWTFQCAKWKKNELGSWTMQAYSLTDDAIFLNALTDSTKYTYRFVKFDESQDIIGASDTLSIVTEKEFQIPNSNFETWYSEKLYSTIGTIYTFYPFAKDSKTENRWWDTSNTKTTPNPGSAGAWYYRSFPGTVPTSEEQYTATYHLNKFDKKKLATGGRNGSIAAEISTVGWGTGNTWTAWSQKAANKTAGSLYIGNYTNKENYGKVFVSRPTKVIFWYRYYSYDNESTEPLVEVYSEDGSKIGWGKITINSTVNEFEKAIINIDYTGNERKKAAQIRVIFSSTNSSSPKSKAIEGEQFFGVGYWDSRHIGSVLTIDDVSLVYDK
ncbi:DUF4493 domain-containing protein [uncultured Bacteroides sp.]|uniref:DUF4493 domain-containing protein n=1 Tax=uncultured Bacteroides sp. TaxID=162156 RepID=UPI0008218A27|nr:DUF4493 domain-containing protein [uncultured Bacteroides sp.]SCH93650.1 Uncharacterised protein [uncultured Bacteroides sp.]